MAANKRKILEAARKHAQKGAKDKALKEYAKLLKLEPRDSKLRLEIGDAHRRWGQVDEAIEAYSKVAEHFMNEGFDARAVAVFKQIQNLDSETFSFHEPLSELYQRMGLTAEAIGCLESAADGYYKAGQRQEALGLLRKMATLDPSNTTSRIKVADLLHQEGLTEDAIAEYDEVVVELEQGNDSEMIDKVFERILEIDPDRVATLGRYAKHLIERATPERAEPLAMRALELDKSPEHYELLADVYRLEKRDEDLVKLYRELAELYRERGDEERTREILQRYVPMDTMDTREKPNGYIDPNDVSGDDAQADDLVLDDTTLLDEDLLSDESLLVSDGDSGFGILNPERESDVLVTEGPTEGSRANEMTCIMPEASLVGESTSGDSGTSRSPVPDADPDQLLAEASVYLRYGKRDQAIANLDSVLEHQPDHRSALEKLGEAYAEGDDSARAVEFWSRAARLAAEDGSTEQAGVLRNRIAALDPAAAEALELAVSAEPGPDSEGQSSPDDLIDSPGADASVADGDSEPQTDSSLESLDFPDGPERDVPELEFDDIEIDVDAASFTEIPSDGPSPMLLEEQMAVDDSSPSDQDAASGEVDSAALTAAGSSKSASGSAQFTEDLEEADFYLQQGLLDEAEAVYTRVLSVAPNHPRALVRLGELAAQRGEDPGSTAAPLGLAEAMAADEIDVPDGLIDADIGTDLSDGLDDVTGSDSPTNTETGDEVDANATTLSGATDTSVDSSIESTDASVDELAGEPVDEPADESVDELADESVDEPAAESVDELADEPADEPTDDPVGEPAAAEEAPSPLATTSVDLDDEPDADAEDDEAGFDLGAELSQALDDDPGTTASGASTSGNRGDTSDDGFASVFAEFKKGVSETLSEADHQARYDLGIAYREMGLLGDAMSELQVAMSDPAHRIGSLQLMALCALDLGEPEQAVGYLQDALSTPDLPPECELSLQLDLGKSYEATGEFEAARTAYQEVQTRDPNFADVESRLTELEARAVKEEPAVELYTPNTAEYETFDGFLDDLDEDEEEELQAASEADGDAVESKKWESFDDVIAEAQSEDDEPSSPVSESPEPVDSVDAVAESEEVQVAEQPVPESEEALDSDAEEVVEVEAEVDPEVDDAPATKSRKKKISFV